MLTKLLNFLRPQRLENEIREELDFHRSHTRGSFGNPALIQDQVRDASTVVWLESLIQDLRYGLRQLRRAPVLVAVSILSLALGIGANTAIFTLIDAVMLQSLPVRDPAKLALFYDGVDTGVYSGNDFPSNIFSYPSWQYLKTQNRPFEELCAFRQGTDRVAMHVSGAVDTGAAERVDAHLVSGNYFHVLGVSAASGRILEASDDAVNAPPAAIISYRFWQDRFHLDSTVIGKTVVLNGIGFTIVGVASREFFGERIQAPPDLWIPLSFQPQILKHDSWLPVRDVFWLNLLGRLKPGVALQSASTAVTAQLQRLYSEQSGTALDESAKRKIQSVRVNLKPGGSGISGLRYLYSEPLHLLMAVVGLVLLIACANISALLLARASTRSREFSARLALGASRSRLARQVLTESVLLSIIGGVAGVFVAWWSIHGLTLLLGVDPVVKVHPDPAVLAFTLALSLLTGILFGLIPALTFSKMEPRLGLLARAPGRGSARFGSAQTLILIQVALSLVLLVGTGLLARSLMALQSQNLGFDRENVIIVHTDPQLAGYTKEQLFPLYREIDARLNQLPGVRSASLATYTPVSGSSSSSNFTVQGVEKLRGIPMDVHHVAVGPHFFEALGIPLKLGRAIGSRDTPASSSVAVVNETFVAKFLQHRQPIGQRFSMGEPFKAPGFEIVGVVADSRYFDLRDTAKPMAFLPAWQPQNDSANAGDFILRTSMASASIMPDVRRALNDRGHKLPVLNVTTLDPQIEESLKRQKLLTGLCSIFGVVALLLACIGIYGTVAYSVSRRTTEIGIRMAIGAQRRTVLWMVLRESVVLTVAGLLVGLPLALGATRWIKSYLYAVPAADPPALSAALLLIGAASLLAAYLPAYRATKIDPMIALRND